MAFKAKSAPESKLSSAPAISAHPATPNEAIGQNSAEGILTREAGEGDRVAVEGVRAPKRLRLDAQRNRDKLVETAAAAFAEHGVDASLEDIARRAGVGIG